MSGLHRITPLARTALQHGGRCFALAALLICAAAPAHAGRVHHTHAGKSASAAGSAQGAGDHDQIGVASYYSSRFNGRRTASGERFDPSAMTAAHMTLPLGTRVRITNLKNGQSVVVRINDRGGFRRHGRILDLSPAAARALSMTGAGVARVGLKRIGGDS